MLNFYTMTIIEKLSDRNSFIFEAILLVLNNVGNLSLPKLQWELFKCGVYVKKPLLTQAIVVMREKGLIGKPDEKKDIPPPAIVQP